MPRSTSDHSSSPIETPAGLRTMASHARRLARSAGDEEAAAKLIEFAEELEGRAATLDTAVQAFSHEDAAAIKSIEDDTDPQSGEGSTGA
jgi:hypothetical protein